MALTVSRAGALVGPRLDLGPGPEVAVGQVRRARRELLAEAEQVERSRQGAPPQTM
jgi:hypothetical protein